MSKAIQYAVGGVVTTGVLVGGVWAYRKYQQGKALGPGDTNSTPIPAPAPEETSPRPYPTPAPPTSPPYVPPQPLDMKPIAWDGALPLPTAAEVKGDLTRNWGNTPADLRPLFLLTEEASRIVGAGRILAVIAYRESRFTPNAHNGNAQNEQAERNGSWRAYENNKARNPSLMHGQAAANFGSGGLYGALAPYFLWTAVQELGDKAPLLSSDPRIMFLPRVASFAAAVYLQRLLANYDIKDHADIKVGWDSISLINNRGSETNARVRQQFLEDAKTVGIDLADLTTIPAKLSADNWPGAAKVFSAVVGKLPTPGKALA